MTENLDHWHLGTAAIGQWIESNEYQIIDVQREVWHSVDPETGENPVVRAPVAGKAE